MQVHRTTAVSQPVPAPPLSEAPALRAREARQPWSRRGSETLLVAALLVIAGGLLLNLRGHISQDAFLALVGGRAVAQHGIPHHGLAIWASGRPWIDQQWLAQWLMYELQRLGGIKLVGVGSVLAAAAGLAGAVVAAQRLGAPPGRVMRVLPLALWCIALGQVVRAQEFCYPLFVATVYLLADARGTRTRRTLWCLPMLVLWGNLHGSASLGAGLIALRGLALAWERRRSLTRSVGAWVMPLVLTLAPGPLLLATPYGTAMVRYYRSTLVNSNFRHLVVEWLPLTSQPIWAVGCLLLAALAGWGLWRRRGQVAVWDALVLLALLAGAILAVRNVVWFGFGALVLVPRWLVPLSASTPPATEPVRKHGDQTVRQRFNRVTLALAVAFLAISLVVTASRTEATLTPDYPAGALGPLRAQLARTPQLTVFADEHYADWLMWHFPQLVGRVAYNASFELLDASQLTSIVLFKNRDGPDWQRPARGYRLLALNVKAYPGLGRYYRSAVASRTLFEGSGLDIVARGGP